MKAPTHKWRHALLLIIFLFSLLCQGQNAYSQWWKDTVWTNETDQSNLWHTKFSNLDSIIICSGNQSNIFFQASTGKEIKRIPGNNEVFFINNDRNFVRLKEDNTKFEIFDSGTYAIIDSLEFDNISVEEYSKTTISNNQKYIGAIINKGFRIWNIETKKIEFTKVFPNETYLKEIICSVVLFNCENSKIYVRLWRKYHDPKKPDKPEYYTTKHQTIIYDLNSKDSIDVIDNNYIFLSNTCKYMIKGVGGDNGIEIYDFNTKEFLFALPLNILTVSGLEFSPDDRYLVTASNNNAFGMTIWNMATGKEHFHYISGATYSNIDVSHDGRFITYSIGGGLRLIRTHFDGVSVNDTFSPEKTFYPNPTNNTITLSFSIEKPLQLNYSLYNGTGNSYKILLNEFSNPGIVQKTFNISELPNGTYFLKITCQEFSLTYKVVIMR